MAKVCGSCGRKVPDRYGFCDSCGAKLPPQSPMQRTKMPAESAPQKPQAQAAKRQGVWNSRRPTLIVIAILLVGLTAGSVVGAALTQAALGHQAIGTGIVTTVTQQASDYLSTQKSTTITLSTATTTQTQLLQLHNLNITSQGQTNILSYVSCTLSESDCASVAIFWIGRANVSIHLLTYRLTGSGTREALINAKNRGVEVKIVLSAKYATAQGSEYQNLKSAGVDIRLNNDTIPTYDNVAVIDNRVVLTGSYTWAKDATYQNLIVIDNKPWASAYDSEFFSIYSSAK